MNELNSITMKLHVDPILMMALQEDISSEDVTTNAVMPEACLGEVELLSKADGVIAGLPVFARVFMLLDEETDFTFYVKDGDRVSKGQRLAVIRGDIRALLSGERVALNYLQRLSGVATTSAKYAAALHKHFQVFKDLPQSAPLNEGDQHIDAVARSYLLFKFASELRLTHRARKERTMCKRRDRTYYLRFFIDSQNTVLFIEES